MVDEQDFEILQAVAEVLKDYVPASELVAVTERIVNLETQIKAIPAGEKGEPGESIKGDPGKDGTDGAPGKDGESIVGSPGKDGRDGIDGKPGIDGKDGRDGIDGKSGIDGLPGKDGRDGTDGTPGEKGVDGKDGRDGREGKDGRDGEPGRDALQIEILPAIDPAKSYPRGTFAKHAGGLLRSTGAVGEGQIKWEVIVSGISDIAYIHEKGQRQFSLVLKTTEAEMSGMKPTELKFSLPAMLYRGIWKDGEYVQGDTVTYSGSTWHCNAERTKAKPGTSEDWQLIVRKGNDGKDGQRGNDGGQGPEGRPGRDLTQMGPDGKKW